jgi:hypothetical protein
VEHLGGEPASFDGGVDATEDTGHLAVGSIDDGGKVGGERDPGSIHPVQPADEADGVSLQCGEVQGAMIGVAHQLQRRLAAGRSHIADVIDGLVEHPEITRRRSRSPPARRW